MATDLNPIFIFIIRHTGWSLEYVKHLPIDILFTTYNELVYQVSFDDYKQAYNSAMIVACLASDKAHRRRPTDIIGQPPQRDKREGDEIWQLAKESGIKVPAVLPENQKSQS